MERQRLKKRISGLVQEYVAKYPKQRGVPDIWRKPIIGFADAYDPYIQQLPQVVAEHHHLPQDFMESPTIVIAYFIPFTEELASTNVGREDKTASEEWARAYKDTNQMMGELSEYLAEKLCEMGYRAAVPGWEMSRELLKSDWSQRHVAYAAGLGTFGINNMLITEKGCCGRYHSIVADIPVEPDQRPKGENCLYKSKGICKKCISNCFSGALTADGFDRRKCYEACQRNKALYGLDICGKCDTDIPCAFIAPQ